MADKYQQMISDLGIPETERRRMLVAALVEDGFTIERNDMGLVTASKSRGDISLPMFVLLCFFGIVPGILYVLYHAKRKESRRSFRIVL